MRRKNDILWKGMMEVIFDDLLRFVFPEAEQFVDMERKFDFLDKELNEMYPEPDKAAETKFVDKLVKVHRLDGGEGWFLVHIEVQGYPDRQFAERMFGYYSRIYSRNLGPVTALAIFTGQNGKDMPRCYSYSFLGTRLVYEYNTCCITDYADEELMASSNPFAVVVLAAKTALLTKNIPEEVLMDQNLLIVRSLLERGISKKKIAAILTFLKNYVVFEDPKISRNFREQFDQITRKTNSMDIFEQVAEMKAEEARTEERENFAKKLLAETQFSAEKIASLAGVSLSLVEKIKESLQSK
jgi:predicted transposase YdaD